MVHTFSSVETANLLEFPSGIPALQGLWNTWYYTSLPDTKIQLLQCHSTITLHYDNFYSQIHFTWGVDWRKRIRVEQMARQGRRKSWRGWNKSNKHKQRREFPLGSGPYTAGTLPPIPPRRPAWLQTFPQLHLGWLHYTVGCPYSTTLHWTAMQDPHSIDISWILNKLSFHFLVQNHYQSD